MKILYSIIAMLIFTTMHAQVGVGTDTPQSDLHVSKTANDDGTIQIDGGIRLGGDETTAGSKGLDGQVLVSKGSNNSAEWETIGKVGNYNTTCGVPNDIAVISFDLQDGSIKNNVDIGSNQLLTALNSLPNGGVIVLRTNTATTYNSSTTYLTVELPSTANVMNKPFILTFDGPSGANNILNSGKNIIINIRASQSNSYIYEESYVSADRSFIYDDFPNLGYDISKLEHESGANDQNILLFNAAKIVAVDNQTWAFLTTNCYVQNPKF